jgi:hypothetical protein
MSYWRKSYWQTARHPPGVILECAVLGKWNAFNFETCLRVILLIFTAWEIMQIKNAWCLFFIFLETISFVSLVFDPISIQIIIKNEEKQKMN